MQNQLLTSEIGQEDMQQVLRRAQELETQQGQFGASQGGVSAFVLAAEEAGISRESTLQALREQFGHPVEGLAAGQMVYAKSADGYFYVASVVEIRGDRVAVKFVNGGDHTVAITELRGFSILPGQKLQANWPDWGWHAVRVESYDASTGRVKANDGMSTETISLEGIRIRAQQPQQKSNVPPSLIRVALLSGGIGATIGAILMRLLMH